MCLLVGVFDYQSNWCNLISFVFFHVLFYIYFLICHNTSDEVLHTLSKLYPELYS